MEWDLWVQTERARLIAEFGIEAAATERLKEEVMIIPARYGWFVEGHNRYHPIPFASLDHYFDDPRFESGLNHWKYRLQEISFRQNKGFIEQVSRYQESSNMALKASRKTGKKRERLWRQAVGVLAEEEL
jgi:hypothetical protein